MKKILAAVPALAALFILSCQKEINPGGFNNGGNTPQLLLKLVIKNGGDSTTAEFGYNSNNKLVSVKTYGVDAGFDIDVQEKFVRNNQGIITQVILKDADLIANGIDSIVSNIDYSNGRYTNKVSVIDFFGVFQFRDSIVYSYNANGTISREDRFLDVGIGGGYDTAAKTEYTYSGNNITAVRIFSYDLSTAAYVEEYSSTITYDAKTSPLILGNEAIVMGYFNWFSANNVIRAVDVYPTDPSLNDTQDYTYTYNSSNRPVSGTVVMQSGGNASFTFTYK